MATSKVVLRSSDNQTFEIDENTALQSQTIKHMMEDLDDKFAVIPLPNVTGKILSKVIDYCNKHAEESKDDNNDKSVDEQLKKWDKEFIKVDQATLFDLIIAANYMNIESLLDFTCQTVADMMIGKSVKQIRKLFNIESDYTPEEEEEVCRANQWAFE